MLYSVNYNYNYKNHQLNSGSKIEADTFFNDTELSYLIGIGVLKKCPIIIEEIVKPTTTKTNVIVAPKVVSRKKKGLK